MKKVLHVIPTLQYGGISSVICNWHKSCHGVLYNFDYLTFNDGPLREQFLNDGSSVNIIPTLRKNFILYFYNVFTIIFKGNYDVIHVHNSFKNGFVLFLAKILGVECRVCHSHTSGLEDKKLTFYFPLLKWLAIKFSNKKLACGQEAGKFLYGNKDFLIVNNTIDLERIFNVKLTNNEIKNKYNIPKGKNIIGHIGRFSDVKNHNFILDLSSKIIDGYHFVLIGDGPEKKRVLEEIDSRGLTSSFTLIKPTTAIPELLSVFDIFILPSRFEGVSLALLEAQAAALNCLVSDTVPIENDVGLNLVSFLPLECIDEWLQELYKLSELGRIEVSFDDRVKSFNLAGLTNTALYEKLKYIYD